jgi:hypothetical protein
LLRAPRGADEHPRACWQSLIKPLRDTLRLPLTFGGQRSVKVIAGCIKFFSFSMPP